MIDRRTRWRALTAAAVALATLGISATPAAAADSIRDRQWYLSSLNVSDAHNITEGAGVIVGLVDTGVDAQHRDLKGAILPGIDSAPNPVGDGRDDIDGHGTQMAGVIVGRGHGSGAGILGIAPAAKIVPASAPINIISNGADIARAIDFSVKHGAKVINMSFTGMDNPAIHGAIRRARAADVVLVAGSGNLGKVGNGEYPAAYPEVISVGAIDRNGKVATFSAKNAQVDVVAPGVEIATTGINSSGYYLGNGTSESTAVVSGAVALVRAKYPKLSAADVMHRITATAKDGGPRGRDDAYGFGRLDLVKALTADVAPVPAESSAAPPADVAVPSVSDEAAPESGPGDAAAEPDRTALRDLVPLGLGVVAGLFVLLIGVGVVVLLVRRQRT